MILNITRTHPDATIPTRAHEHDAGLDLYALKPRHVLRHVENEPIRTGIAVAIPPGYVGLVFPRSGLGFREGVTLTNAVGVIDSGYRGEIKVSLSKHWGDITTIHSGDRIAQLVITPIVTPTVVEVDSLDDTERGTGGFGSSGV